jgi:hypothetical protein
MRMMSDVGTITRRPINPEGWFNMGRGKGGDWPFSVGTTLFLVVGGLTLLFGGCAVTHNLEYSTGHRDGVVQKASVKGWPWRTRECELALDGFKIGGSGKVSSGGNVFACSVTDSDVWAVVESLPAGQVVRVRYSQKWWVVPWIGRTNYIVTGVEVQ